MSLFEMSNQSFNVASVLYAIAFVLYAGQLVSAKAVFAKGSTWTARLAWLTHTAALALRWRDAGLGHPPWTNLYESLVFFGWGVMGVHLILELRMKFQLTGVFATAVTFAAMGVASLHPHKEIEPLVPALQSWWLLFHVFMACIAYAFFLGSSFVCVFYLLKDRVRQETLTGAAALVCALFLAIAAGKTFFATGQIEFFKVANMNGQDVIMNFKDQAGNPVKEFVSIPGAAGIFWPLLAFYVLAGAVLLSPASRGRKWARAGYALFFLAAAAHAVILAKILSAPRHVEGLALKSNPYRFAAVVMTFGIAGFFGALLRWKDRLLARLPELGVLDRWGYEAILLGVPFMTLNLVSGAVWAYYAWGRYWGWDPKETWALITWLIYVLYLHMRILGGWRGRKTAVISVLGFFVVIFTYLGVNLVISGLHSYATG